MVRSVKTLLLQRLAIEAMVMCFAFVAHAQTYQYTLQPGSTITPYANGQPIGPSESLSGTFSWSCTGYDQIGNLYTFEVMALDFQSSSYSLTFDTNASVSVTGSGYFTLGSAVYTKGLAASPAFLTGPEGTYAGNPWGPSQLSLSEYLWPGLRPPSGPAVAWVSFTAVLVPEPNALIVFGLGLFAVIGRRRRGV